MPTGKRSTLTVSKEYGTELILVSNGNIEVRCSTDMGRVVPEWVRVVDTKTKKELAYWNHDEFMESEKLDPTGALAAALSAIELVFTGQYPPKKGKKRGS